MALHPRELKLGEALVRLKVIDQLQLASAIASADQWGQRLTESLLRLRLAREQSIVEAIASLTRIQKVDLAATAPDPAALALLDAEFCRSRGIFPFALVEQGRVLHLAMVDPSDIALADEVASRARVRVQRFVAGETTIQKAVQRHYLGMEKVGLAPLPEEAPISDLEELKLVDINGRTLQLSQAVMSLREQTHAPEPRRPSEPAPDQTAPVARPAEVTVQNPASDALARTERQLSALRQAQENSDRVLRALIGLLLERGYFTADELKSRISRTARGGV